MKKMLNTLARRCFAANRGRNLIAVLAIALTAVLFTSVTTIAQGAWQSIILTMQLQKGSRSDGDFRNMTREQFEALKEADFIEEAGLRMPVAFLTNTNRHNIELDVMDKTQAELTFCSPTHGTMPQAANEIVASDLALKDLGAEAEVGAEVTISFTVRGQEYTFPMIVSGWYESTNDQFSTMIAGTAFRDENPSIFTYTYDTDREMADTYYSDIIAKSTRNIKENMRELALSLGGDPDNIETANYLPAVVNEASIHTLDLSLAVPMAAFVILFIFCGYLLIFNVFDIAVMQDIRRYGLYRTIGMSKKQVKRLISRQAIWVSCIGIPIGMTAGFFIGKQSLPTILSILSVQYADMGIEITPSPFIFAGAAVLTAFTVFLSTRKPLRTATGIPPIEAFHYAEASAAAKRAARKSRLETRISRLAFSNLGRNKRRTAFIISSLSLCIILLNSAGTAALSVDIEKQVALTIRTDYAVVNAASTNGQEGFTSREQGLSQQTIEDISSQPGVSDASAIYKNTQEDTNVTYDFGIAADDDFTNNEQLGLVQGAYVQNEIYFWFTLGDDNRPMCNVYGMEETALSRLDIREGETDVHSLYEKMEKGEGVLVGTHMDYNTMEINEDLDFVEVGDMITVYKNGKEAASLPVLAKAALNGDDEEIGYTSAGAQAMGDGIYLYLPSSVFKELYDDPSVYKYSFNIEDDQEENMAAFLDNYMKSQDPSIDYLSAESARESAQGTRIMLNFIGGLLGIIFGAAGILNLINTMVTTILTRRHEFATMRSIGMTQKQLTRMMLLEGLYYALGACIAGLLLSVAVGFGLVKPITGSIWYFTFHFTLFPALGTCGLLLLTAVLIPILALKCFNRGSIVEQLRAAE